MTEIVSRSCSEHRGRMSEGELGKKSWSIGKEGMKKGGQKPKEAKPRKIIAVHQINNIFLLIV